MRKNPIGRLGLQRPGRMGLSRPTSAARSTLPLTGDLVFGPQANAGMNGVAAAGYTVVSGYEVMVEDMWLPGLPLGWRAAFTNFWCSNGGTATIEVAPGNTNEISWGSVFTDFTGASFVSDVPFGTVTPKVMPDGGFAISDALPAVSDGAALRFVIKSTLGAKRPAGHGVGATLNARGELGRRAVDEATGSPTIASKRTANSLALGGSGAPNNGEAYRVAGLLIPKPAGYRSFLLYPSTSILAPQESEFRYLASVGRNVYGYLPVGLDDVTNGRMGWAQFAVNASAIIDTFDSSEGYQKRKAFFDAIAAQQGGRQPFTDGVLDFRNDVSRTGVNGADLAATVVNIKAKITDGLAKAKAAHPGLPWHILTLPPMLANNAPLYYATDSAHQTVPGGEYRPAALITVNQWLKDNYASLGFASVVDIAASFAEPSTGLDYATWRLTEFSKAGGATLDAADYASGLASGTNLAATGVILTCADGSKPPQPGEYLVFEPGHASNAELVGVVITSVVLISGARYTVKCGNTSAVNTTKAHAAGTVVKTTHSKDSIHPGKRLHDMGASETIIPWKATI